MHLMQNDCQMNKITRNLGQTRPETFFQSCSHYLYLLISFTSAISPLTFSTVFLKCDFFFYMTSFHLFISVILVKLGLAHTQTGKKHSVDGPHGNSVIGGLWAGRVHFEGPGAAPRPPRPHLS